LAVGSGILAHAQLEEMNWLRNRTFVLVLAMILLAAATVVVAGGRVPAPDASFPAHAAHLSSIPLGGADMDQAVDPHHRTPSADGVHAAGMVDGLPCDAACPGGSSGCVPVPLASHADSLAQREAATIRMRPGDDLMLSGVNPGARPKPPKSIA
jgi:hypothetical protein